MSCLTEKVTANEYTVPYIKFGSGKKTLVILPGLGIQSVIPFASAIKKQYESFCKDYTVYLFERREDMPKAYSVYDMADDTAKAINELGLSDICLFGVSQGGMMAMIIASEFPQLVGKLALGSSAAFVSQESEKVLSEWLSLAQSKDTQGLYLSFGEKVYSAEFFQQHKSAFEDMAKTVTEKDLKRFITLVKGMQGFDAREIIADIKCPVLAIGDTSDNVLGSESTPLIAQLMKNKTNFEMYMYSGCGHAAYDTAEGYTNKLSEFFNKE